MGNLKAVLTLSLGLLGVSCQDHRTDAPSDFVDYWSASDPWCEHQSCGDMQTKKDCELAWPTPAQTEEALELAELTSDQLAKCMKSSIAFDDCIFTLSCEELTSGDMACPQEYQRFQLDCASVIDALEMILAESSVDDASSSP